MARLIMGLAALLIFGSAACRTPQQTEETRPSQEVGSPEVIPPIPTGKVRPSVEVGPPKITPSEEGDGSDGEVRLAALERRLAVLEKHVAAMWERVTRLKTKPPLPRLEEAESDLDDTVADFVGALETLASPSSSEGER